MIPHSSAGVQSWGQPLHAVYSGTGRADLSQPLGQPDRQSEQPSMPVPQLQGRPPALIDLTANDGDVLDREPPAKRLKIDVHAGSGAGDGSPASAGVGESKSTPSTTTSKPPSLSWRARPVWSFQALLSEVSGSAEINGESAAGVVQDVKPPSPPSFPGPPWKLAPADTIASDPAGPQDGAPAKEVQTTPYHIETPSVAPVMGGEKVADFSPWMGNHPEDVLNEQTAKQGYYDRTQVSQNESNTARPSLYAQLKHRSGLQILSSVFAAALEKRQGHNMVTAPSTFKPPPRVTLTDNKREAWLRDLANPNVPLRKLSRTIPHGIRGRVLLDQCLTKWVPVGRAVWLAKCVGANEIRAFKRKGTSGALAIGLEAKWVRDWTANVQQFLEGVITSCGVADWKMKMTYAVSLTARLFFEQLLDHDQYLGWFLTSLEAAPFNTLPVWLLMLGIYWSNILRYRKRGRRLAELLLDKLQLAIKADSATSLRPLTDRLSLHIRKLTLEHTSSMVLPQSWEKYKDLLSSCLNLNDNVHRAVFQNLAERNARVQRPWKCEETTQQPAQQRIIQLFDSIGSSRDITSVSAASLGAIDDKAALVLKLLEWAATPFRYGVSRVYAGARLLRKWKIAGVDVDTCIISFLGESQMRDQLNIDNIYHIVSELVRSQTFSVGKYLQWLMAKGLPVSRLPEHVHNLRNTLLQRAGVEVSKEASTIAILKALIAERLPRVFGSVATSAGSRDPLPSDLTWAVKSELGQWIRRGVTEFGRDPRSAFQDLHSAPGAEHFALTPGEFYTVRDILESFGDLSILADVLKQATVCNDGIVLASAADTVNYHFRSFCVIGATTDLFKRLVESYARLKRLGSTSLDLIFSLIDLGLRLPGELNTVALLRQDLSRIESKSSMAAPSPLSDHIPSAFNEADPLFLLKLDQLLSSASGIDESTLDTIFNLLIKQIESSGGHAKLSVNETCRYLSYLRPFHPKRFDIMIVRWICGLLRSTTGGILSQVLPPLIGVGCVTIQAFVSLVRRLLKSENMISNPRDLRIDLLQLLVPPPAGQSRYFDMVTYRFHLSRKEFMFKHPEEVFDIIRDAIALIDSQSQEGNCRQGQVDLGHSAMALLQILLTKNPESAVQHCTEKLIGQHPSAVTVLTRALDSLLGLDTKAGERLFTSNGPFIFIPIDTGPAPPDISVAEKVIELTNDFSLPFCQLKLQLLFNAETKGDVRNEIVDVMFKAAVADSRSRRSNWVGLVRLMSHDAVRQIRERAEKNFFAIPLFEESPDGCSSFAADNSSSLETAKLYLTIIEKLGYSIPDVGPQAVIPALTEKMDILLQRLISMQANYSGTTELSHGVDAEQMIRSRGQFERAVAFWFSALLRMIVLHRTAFSVPSAALRPSALPEQTRLLISIFCITFARLPDSVLRLFPAADYFPHSMRAGDCRPCPGILLQTHALDVAASLIDTFPDEARHQCARYLREKCPPFARVQNDSRFLYLLGPLGDSPSSTNLTLPVSIPSPAASGSTPAPTPSGNPTGGFSHPQQPAFVSGVPTGLPDGLNCAASHLCLQYRGRAIGAYPVRPWELLEDAAPIAGTNDTAVSLGYFDARRVRV
ncbi:mediator of RNA polymerase II transcription subunit 12 [Aspergillus novofumigatus IBT 16806]|uniref:Mediator of RNA polymerase II transcription subunit 12 n=1 Tax=Aspergillus novofumigatus (strain IBT 16806) TaxID=1392255 RepID=A0A2I1C234_ASPN1|nr:mediator of RNA polymerase II transcription subunit 12 [Aspergillus novofumigatus IBT 16806]PKX91641.1 mediator of RNA polymerase II transcription subunit 12 [Aspergillus novofumigatus IBT 16806]